MQACIPPVRRVQLTFSACTITLGHRDTILPHFMISSVVPVANSCQRRKSSSLMGMSTDSWPLSVDDRDRSTSLRRTVASLMWYCDPPSTRRPRAPSVQTVMATVSWPAAAGSAASMSFPRGPRQRSTGMIDSTHSDDARNEVKLFPLGVFASADDPGYPLRIAQRLRIDISGHKRMAGHRQDSTMGHA